MATIGASLTSGKNTSRLSYITVGAFNAAFFTYTQTTSNFVTSGTLTAVINPDTGVAVTSLNCPAGRVLRETGRKLYATAAYPGVSTYMVSVYDSVLGVNGFIDPNSTLFAIYNVDKPNFIDAASTEHTSYGPPVYTGSTVTATGNITSVTGNVAATAGYVSAGLDVSANRNVSAGTNLIATAGGLVITTKGSGNSAGAATAGKVTLVAGGAVVSTTAVTTNSLIFLSYNDATLIAPTGALNVSGRTAGTSFTIGSTVGATDTNEVVWLIIN